MGRGADAVSLLYQIKKGKGLEENEGGLWEAVQVERNRGVLYKEVLSIVGVHGVLRAGIGGGGPMMGVHLW